MTTIEGAKKIGVWLDHSKAHFIDISKGPAGIETAYSAQESEVRFKGEHGDGTKLSHNRATNNENHKHNREREIMDEYYKMIADRLKGYDSILLFGPTTAKDELYNKLTTDKQFDLKEIFVEPADRLSEKQMIARVKKLFGAA